MVKREETQLLDSNIGRFYSGGGPALPEEEEDQENWEQDEDEEEDEEEEEEEEEEEAEQEGLPNPRT